MWDSCEKPCAVPTIRSESYPLSDFFAGISRSLQRYASRVLSNRKWILSCLPLLASDFVWLFVPLKRQGASGRFDRLEFRNILRDRCSEFGELPSRYQNTV